MSQLFSREYEAIFGQIDNRGVARPSFLFDMMQDAAVVHASALLGPDDPGFLWVLCRAGLSLRRPLRPYERVRCETWCPGVRGPSWYRAYRFHIGAEAVGEARSIWVALDPVTRRILRPSSIPAARAFLNAAHGALFEPLPKFSCAAARPHDERTVRYSDLDRNGHLNNVKIVDLIADALELQKQPGYVSGLQVNFIKESVCGERLALSCGTVDGARFVRGDAGGAARFEALAVLTPLPEEKES